MNRLRSFVLATAALLLAPLAAPAAVANDERVVFTVGMIQDVDSLNPFTGIVAEAYEIWGLMYDQLVGYAQEDFSPTPAVAQSWEESEDGLTWTYTIREGISFSDGEPLTAQDVAYTFNRIIEGSYEQTNFGSYVANITGVEAPDDTTVVMTVEEPSPIMLRLAVPILPEHVWSEIDGEAVTDFANEPTDDGGAVGSGPFRLIEHRANEFLRLEANADYWAGAPNVDEVAFRVFTNVDSLAQALRRGEIDIANGLEANVFDSLEGAEGVTIANSAYSGFDELAFNTGAALNDGTPIGDGHPALEDVAVRRAISHAVDTGVLLDRVLGGYGTTGSSVIPPIYADLHWDPGEQVREFDLAEANRLLDEAGYARGAGGVRQMPDGSRDLSMRLVARSESQTSQQSAQFIQGWLEQIGIPVEVEVISEDTLTEVIGEGTFDMFEWGWVVEPDPDYQLSTFTCANRSYIDAGVTYANLSDSFYCNEAYDALYLQQAGETDPDARAEIVREMQQILYDDAPYVVTFYYDNLEAYRSDRWTGLRPQPDPGGSLIFQYGTYTYRNVEPVAPESGETGSDGSGLNVPLVAGAGAALLALAGVGALALRRRRPSSADVE